MYCSLALGTLALLLEHFGGPGHGIAALHCSTMNGQYAGGLLQQQREPVNAMRFPAEALW
jgi:hypothetical protein